MADIRSYLREKEKRERHTKQETTYQDKIIKHKLSFFYRILLVFAVVGATATLIWIQYRNYVYEGYERISSVSKEEVPGVGEQRFANTVLTYSKDGAHVTDSKGMVLWNQTYEMQSPMISICGNVAAFADYNGSTIYIYNTSEKLGTIDTTMPIRNMSVAANGVVAAVLEASDITWLRIYNTEGNLLVESKISMKDSGYPVSVSLSPNALMCAVSYFYTDMGVMKSSVAFYNFGEVGQNKTDNFVAGYDYSDTLVPYVQFMNEESSFAVGDDRLLFFNGNQKPENVNNILLSEEIQSVYYNSQYVGLVFVSESGNGKRIDVYDVSGNKLTSQEITMNYTDIMFDQENFVVYNETELFIGTVDGREKYNGGMDKPVSLLIPTGKQYRYLMVTKDSIDTIRLK